MIRPRAISCNSKYLQWARHSTAEEILASGPDFWPMANLSAEPKSRAWTEDERAILKQAGVMVRDSQQAQPDLAQSIPDRVLGGNE